MSEGKIIGGGDIGYSNCIAVAGREDDDPVVSIFPSGAGLAEFMPRNIGMADNNNDVMRVLVNGKEWVAGVEPGRLQGVERVLHHDYISTESYMALYYGLLIKMAQPVIDVFVTGLPVNQMARADELADLLKGKHKIAPSREIHVKEVKVLEQPTGAYLNSLFTQSNPDILSSGRTLVVDPGQFSFDYVIIEQGELRTTSSGTNLFAMSHLIAETDTLMAKEFGEGPGVDKIEKAMQEGKSTVLLYGEDQNFMGFVDQAKGITVDQAITEMRRKLRNDQGAIDTIIMAGGGATFYESAIREIFPKSNIIIPDNPVYSNAYGFWRGGSVM